jgi:hypothetical protein
MRTELLKHSYMLLDLAGFLRNHNNLREPEGERPLKIPRCRREDNIRVDQKLRCEGVDI